MHRRGMIITLVLMFAVCMAAIGIALWSTASALRDNSLAVRQRIRDIYAGQLALIDADIERFWNRVPDKLLATQSMTPSEAFAYLVRENVCDGAVLFDKFGSVTFPIAATTPTPSQDEQKTLADAKALLESKKADDAISLLTSPNASPEMLLFALEAMGRENARFEKVSRRLAESLQDYSRAMPSARRVFLMDKLMQVSPTIQFSSLEPERLSLRYALYATPPAGTGLRESHLPGIVAFNCGPSCTLLVKKYPIFEKLDAIVARYNTGRTEFRLLARPTTREDRAFASAPVSWLMPGYFLIATGPDVIGEEIRRSRTAYLVAGGAMIACVLCLLVIAITYVVQQARVARLKNDLIATVSHELKTPIASMRALVETLQEGGVTDEKSAKEYLEMTAKEIERLSRLIDNFLAFSRMERNKRVFDFREVDVGNVMREAADSVLDRFACPDCELRVEYPPGLPKVNADREALTTIIINLLDNAYKYTGDVKKVSLRARAENNSVVIEVEDNGIGIPPAALNKVFDRFYQVDDGLARKAGGCGLGLAIVKYLVEAHGGAVNVKSEVGKGSTLSVELPAVFTTETQRSQRTENERIHEADGHG